MIYKHSNNMNTVFPLYICCVFVFILPWKTAYYFLLCYIARCSQSLSNLIIMFNIIVIVDILYPIVEGDLFT